MFNSMKKKYLLRLAPVALLALGACSENLYELRETDAQGGPYTQVLSQAYLTQANEEAGEMDYNISEFLSEKGLRAAGGEHVFADNISNWDVPADKIQELAEARQLLREAYKDKLHLQYPDLVAAAQVSFDTWLAALYYGDEDDAEEARQGMVEALAELAVVVMAPELEAMAEDDKVALNSATDVLSSEQVIAAYNQIPGLDDGEEEGFVFFPNDGMKLGDNDASMIEAMAEMIMAEGYKDISIHGFASQNGSKDVNARVSSKRAEVVRDALMDALGDHASQVRVSVSGKGEAPSHIPARYARSAVIKVK